MNRLILILAVLFSPSHIRADWAEQVQSDLSAAVAENNRRPGKGAKPFTKERPAAPSEVTVEIARETVLKQVVFASGEPAFWAMHDSVLPMMADLDQFGKGLVSAACEKNHGKIVEWRHSLEDLSCTASIWDPHDARCALPVAGRCVRQDARK